MSLSVKSIRAMVDKAIGYRLSPIRITSVDVVEVKDGLFKGKDNKPPRLRKNGAFSCYAIILSEKKNDYVLVKTAKELPCKKN